MKNPIKLWTIVLMLAIATQAFGMRILPNCLTNFRASFLQKYSDFRHSMLTAGVREVDIDYSHMHKDYNHLKESLESKRRFALHENTIGIARGWSRTLSKIKTQNEKDLVFSYKNRSPLNLLLCKRKYLASVVYTHRFSALAEQLENARLRDLKDPNIK